jgi:uncharacterized protein (TIGR03790 family)
MDLIIQSRVRRTTLRYCALHWIFWLVAISLSVGTAWADPLVLLPKYRLGADELGVIVNDQDPLSRQIADYYMARRRIPAENRIHVSLPPKPKAISTEIFAAAYDAIQQQTPAGVKAYALTWTRPYRVERMSIGTAITAGFDRAWASAKTCAPTRRSPLFPQADQDAAVPASFRPTMVLAATDFDSAKALIDRGLAADDSWPSGTAYLLETRDKARSVRSVFYEDIAEKLGGLIKIEQLEADALSDRSDVLFYFTGRTWVEDLDTLQFVPGAIADHLTSAGGVLPPAGEPGQLALDPAERHGQMSAIEWLNAGATGSYGTVIEPCNLLGKFPHPGLVMQSYLRGATLIEAYWRSVAMPGEGIFIGDPLASPFGGYRLVRSKGRLVLNTHALRPGRYRVETASSPTGPFSDSGLTLLAWPERRYFALPSGEHAVYRLVRLP